MLARHEVLSELHRVNLDRQDEIVAQHKQEVLAQVHTLRQQLNEVVATSNDLADSRRASLESKLRQLLGELGQAQEILEHSRGQRFADQTRGIARPLRFEARVGNLALEAGVASWQGSKEVQEDRFIINMDLKSPEGHRIVGFAVLDGHSGSLCVDHLVERLPVHLQACLAAKPSLTEDYLRQAVAEACSVTDNEFLDKARRNERMDGSTMILALVYPDDSPRPPRPVGSCRLLIANVGDSRAVLCRSAVGADDTGSQCTALRLSEDHKPSRPDEQQRIRARGGVTDFHGVVRVFMPASVMFGGRVIPRCGLAVSRAFGDVLLKEPERYGCTQVCPGGLVIVEPELHVIDIEPLTDRFLILACDGIWDVFRDEDAIAACAGQAGTELAAHSLVRHAFAAGSGDNISAIVVAWRTAD